MEQNYLFKKLPVAQLVMKILRVILNPNVHYRVDKNPRLFYVLSQTSPVQDPF